MTINNTNFDLLLDDAKEYLHYFIESKYDTMKSLQVFQETKTLIIHSRRMTEGASRHYDRYVWTEFVKPLPPDAPYKNCMIGIWPPQPASKNMDKFLEHKMKKVGQDGNYTIWE